jgi:uncharacterized protein YdeI (YjbR/CyaY-like superfamily)
MENAPHFYAPNREAWRAWLSEHHQTETAVWLIYDKGKDRTMSWQDIVEEALCFGWIDSRPGKVSEKQSKLYISKRKPKSVWSKINKASIERLVAAGQMMPAGMASVAIAKENGSWSALDLSDNLVYPPELVELLAGNPAAKENFENFPTGTRRNTLYWIYDAKTEKTRTSRIQQAYDAARDNVRLR